MFSNKTWIAFQGLFGTAERYVMIILMYKIGCITDTVVAKDTQAYVQLLPEVGIALCLQIVLFYFARLLAIRVRVSCGYAYHNKIYKNIVYEMHKEGVQDQKANALNIYNTQIEQIAGFASRYAEIGISILTVVFAVIYMSTVSVKLLLVSAIFVPISGYAYERFARPLQEKNGEILRKKEKQNRLIKENLDGFYISKAYLLEDFFRERFDLHSESMKRAEKQKDKIAAVLGRVGILLRYIPQLIVPLYGGWLCYCGQLSVGELVAANTVIWYVVGPIENLLDIYRNKKELIPAFENIERLLKINEHVITNDTPNQINDDSDNLVTIKDLEFSYAQNKQIFSGISLNIKKGDKVLLLGKSGAGKSTLAKVLCGIEGGYKGSIQFYGQNVRGNALVQKQVTYVPQEPYIFSGSIAENICMGHVVTKEQMCKAAEVVGASRFITGFTDGYETKVGEGGVQLSGGQRKRIAMARAIIADVDLVILDEPTSSLDQENRAQIMKKLMEFWEHKTVIIISHNEKDMPNMDQIYTIWEGKICHE